MTIIHFVRHAQTEKEPKDQDKERLLTIEGKKQAMNLRQTLLSPQYDMVVASPAARTISTAAYVAGIRESEVATHDVLYPDPHKNAINAELDRYFQKIGYASVAKYIEEGAGNALGSYAKLAWRELAPILFANRGVDDGVLVVGHAVILPALGMAACSGNGWCHQLLLEMNLGECQGFAIKFNNDQVPDHATYIK